MTELSCTNCIYVSTTDHFIDGDECPLCYSDAEPLNE